MTEQLLRKLATRPGVRRVAVENFLGSLQGLTEREALANLELDARSYNWNSSTRAAIRAGISSHFHGGVS